MTTDTLRIEELQSELRSSRACKEGMQGEMDGLRAELADWKESASTAASETCTLDERHCTCVPLLRARVAELEAHPTNVAWSRVEDSLLDTRTALRNLVEDCEHWDPVTPALAAARALIQEGGDHEPEPMHLPRYRRDETLPAPRNVTLPSDRITQQADAMMSLYAGGLSDQARMKLDERLRFAMTDYFWLGVRTALGREECEPPATEPAAREETGGENITLDQETERSLREMIDHFNAAPNHYSKVESFMFWKYNFYDSEMGEQAFREYITHIMESAFYEGVAESEKANHGTQAVVDAAREAAPFVGWPLNDRKISDRLDCALSRLPAPPQAAGEEGR